MDKEWLKKLPLDSIDAIHSVSGGDVNDAYEIESKGEKYFLLVQPGTKKDFFIKDIREKTLDFSRGMNHGLDILFF